MRISHIIILLLSILCFGCASNTAKQECSRLTNDGTDTKLNPATPIQAEGLSNLYKVSNDIYRSAQPEKGGMTSAKALGIKTVISLRETELDAELNQSENTDLNLIHIPIETRKVNTDNILNVMRTIRDAPKPILIHCRHGSDRTGLMIAMYRMVFENWPKSCAKDELINGGFGYHIIFPNIPKEIDNADIDAIKKSVFDPT